MMAVEPIPESRANDPQSLSEALERLRQLRERGELTPAEYSMAKAAVLGQKPPGTASAPHSERPYTDRPYTERDVQQWAVLLHLSPLLVFVIPPFGLAVPFVIWQLKKAEMPELDPHGKAVANWIFSSLIYFVTSALLIVILIGLPLLLTVIVLGIVFPIVGATKASHGQVWRYPLSIRFIE